MSTNTNTARQMRQYDCQENDPRLAGGYWSIHGAKCQLDVHRSRILERFTFGLRDNQGKPIRPVGELRDSEREMLANLYGLNFEPSRKWPGQFHPVEEFRFLGWFSLM